MFSDTRPRIRINKVKPDEKKPISKHKFKSEMKSVEDIKNAKEIEGPYRTLFCRQ